METTVKVTAVLTNPDGVWEDVARVGCPDGMPEGAIAMQVLAKILAQQGLISTPTADTVEFIPLGRVKNIELKAGGITLGGDINAAARAAASVQRIKL